MEYTFTVLPTQPWADLLIAQLGEIGFDSFSETFDGFMAYIAKDRWHPQILSEVLLLQQPPFEVSYT